MDTQPTTQTPPPADDSDSLELTPTVVEQPVPPAAPGAPVAPPEQSFTPPPKPPHKKIHELLTRVNVYIALFILIVFAVAGSIVIALMHNNSSQQPSVTNQQLSPSALNQVSGSTPVVGTSSQELTIQPSTTFGNSVLIKNNLSVAGTIKVGGSLNLSGVSVTGASTFGNVQTASINASGNVTAQGDLTVQKSLTVAGNANVNGTLSAGQIATSSLLLNGNLDISHHIVITAPSPGRSDGSSLGNGGTSSVNGTDTAGAVIINTGSNPSAGCYIAVNFSTNYGNTPHVTLTPLNPAAAVISYYVQPSAAGFNVCSASSPSAGQTLDYDYIVID